jgi:subtilisin family serine protease
MWQIKKQLRTLLAVCLIIGLLMAVQPAGQAAQLKADSTLVATSIKSPYGPVGVIVQKADRTERAENRAIHLGGRITRELSIINAFVVELQASAALELSRDQSVKWVSLDAPVVKSGMRCPECIDTANLVSAYPVAIRADMLWNETPGRLQGRGVTVAIVDSGINDHYDLRRVQSRVLSSVAIVGPAAEPLLEQPVDASIEQAADPSTDQALDSSTEQSLDPSIEQALDPSMEQVLDASIGQDSGAMIEQDFEVANGLAPDALIKPVLYMRDAFGHGTHIAGIIGGNGAFSNGRYIGVAPKVDYLDVKVNDGFGAGTTAELISGLQWVNNNKNLYNIRIVNLSLNSSIAESYLTSPLDAAVEVLWFNGIVVVVSAGNNGAGPENGILYPPANDPFVITVGAVDDFGTANTSDDVLASFSAYGTTEAGFPKPDLVAPGKNIVSLLASNQSLLARMFPDHLVFGGPMFRSDYFRLSGTSMSAAVVSGSVALLLEDEPNLTPDQVKFRLMETAADFSGPVPGSAGAGYLDIYTAVHAETVESANTGVAASSLLWSGSDPLTWNSVAWNSVAWNSVAWNSVAWNSVAWNSVAWNSLPERP